MICVVSHELTVICSVSGDKITSLPRWTAIINTRQSSTRTHTLPHCTHNRWWLVLGSVTTKENHPRLRIAYISYVWRVIKFTDLNYNLTRAPLITAEIVEDYSPMPISLTSSCSCRFS